MIKHNNKTINACEGKIYDAKSPGFCRDPLSLSYGVYLGFSASKSSEMQCGGKVPVSSWKTNSAASCPQRISVVFVRHDRPVE